MVKMLKYKKTLRGAKMITKEIIEFKNYGKCVKLSNGIIEAISTVEMGPRIVFFGFIILLKGILLSDIKKLIKR